MDRVPVTTSRQDRLLAGILYGIATFLYTAVYIMWSVLSAPNISRGSFSDALELFGTASLLVFLPVAVVGGITGFAMAHYFKRDVMRGKSFLSRGLPISLAVTGVTCIAVALLATLIVAGNSGGGASFILFLPFLVVFGGLYVLLPALPFGIGAGWLFWRLSRRKLPKRSG